VTDAAPRVACGCNGDLKSTVERGCRETPWSRTARPASQTLLLEEESEPCLGLRLLARNSPVQCGSAQTEAFLAQLLAVYRLWKARPVSPRAVASPVSLYRETPFQ
jgi:hypothetical protein